MATEDDLYSLGAVLARVPLSARAAGVSLPQAPAGVPRRGTLRTQQNLEVEPGPDGVTVRAEGGAEFGYDSRGPASRPAGARTPAASVQIGAGVHGEVEGSITRSDGMVRYALSGEVSGFLSAGANARGFGGSYRADERGTARFEVAVPESAPPGTDLRSINPFDPTSMPVGTRITLDAARHSSREFNANLRYLATRDRTDHEQGVSVAIEAAAPGRVRVTAGPREAIEAYHGIGVQAGPARLMAGRNDRYSGGTIRTAEFDLTTEEGRSAYDRFIARADLPERDGPGISGVSRVERLDGRSKAQLDIGLGSLSRTFETDPNSASTVRTTDGSGNTASQTTIRYRERNAELQIEQTYDPQGVRTGRNYTYRLTPTEHEAGVLNIAYGRDRTNGFRAGQEVVLRLNEADMERLREIAGRAHQNLERTGGNPVIRQLVEGYGGEPPRTTTDFAIELIRNPSTHAGLPATLHTLATRSGPESRRSIAETLTPLPGTAEGRMPEAQAPATSPPTPATRPRTEAPRAPSPLSLSDERHPDHRLYAAIRDRAPQGTSEERLAEATLRAREAQIRPEQVTGVAPGGGRLWIAGAFEGSRVDIDLSRPAPPIGETNARLLAMAVPDANQAREREQQIAQQQPVMRG